MRKIAGACAFVVNWPPVPWALRDQPNSDKVCIWPDHGATCPCYEKSDDAKKGGRKSAAAVAVLSDADKDALGRMPVGRWFKSRELPYMVTRPEWRCERLSKGGHLETRVNGEYPSFSREYFLAAKR